MEIKLDDMTIAFTDALVTAKAVGNSAPRFNFKLIVEPGSEQEKQIEKAMLDAATAQWKGDGKKILDMIVENGDACLVKKDYKNKKGEVYDGFAGKHYLSAGHAKQAPTILDRFGKEVFGDKAGRGSEQQRAAERLIYSGCKVLVSLDIWAQDNDWGRRLNAQPRGVMWRGEGQSFGGGSAPASEDEFAQYADTAEDYI